MDKHILWLASWYPNALTPYDGDFIQRHARAVALFQKITVIHIKKDEEGKMTTDVQSFSSSQNNLEEIIVFYKPIKTRLHYLNRLLSAIKYKKIYRHILRNYINENGKPDLVHVQVALNAGIQALWLKKNFHIPFIVSEHWTGYLPGVKFGLKDLSILSKKAMQKIFFEAGKITVVSDVLGKAISNQVISKGYIIIPNAVDTSIFFPEYFPVNSTLQFIHISSLAYQKNCSAIINAFKLLKSNGYDFQLLIYGPDKPGLKQLVKENELENCIAFKNEVPQSQLASELRTADALILYSRYETFGCVVIEANACGVPAILSNLPVFKEYIVENENGLFVTPDNPAALAEKVADYILGKYQFDKKSISRKTVEKFSYTIIGKQFYDLYKTLILI
ncbi:MAG: glycosyltransferase [Ginsengibacter sp.]